MAGKRLQAIDVRKSLSSLMRFPVLKVLPKDMVRSIFEASGCSFLMSYDPGQTLIMEKQFDAWMFWLLEGSIQLSKNGVNLKILNNKGTLFGEMGPINNNPRSATLTALTKVLVVGLDLSVLDRMDENSSDKFHRELKCLTISRMDEANDDLAAAKKQIQGYEAFLKNQGLWEDFNRIYNGGQI